MTVAIDQSSQIVRQLIDSCYEAHEGYRSAAEAVSDGTLKRLFGIYAQQRTRFAEELREYTSFDGSEFEVKKGAARTGGDFGDTLNEVSDERLLQFCLESDRKTLELYRKALLERGIPSRAHFVISAQCSLMERVHDRINGILNGAERRTFAFPMERQTV